jgi:hypothetical protein
VKSSPIAIAAVFLLLPVTGFASDLANGVSVFSRPVPGRNERLAAQIGGVGGNRDKDEKDKDEEKDKEPKVADGTVNPRKAMLYSLLIPGLGQQVIGREERARVFYGVEAAIWTSFVAFRLQGDGRRDRYIDFAEFNAAVSAEGKDDTYWRTIAQYERSDPGPFSANELVRRQARALYPGDFDRQQQYISENSYVGDDAWDWQNADNLARYRDLRSRSIDSYDRAEFSIAMAIAHRIVSMIDAARLAGSINRAAQANQEPGSLAPKGSFGFKLETDGDDRVPMLTYKLKF